MRIIGAFLLRRIVDLGEPRRVGIKSGHRQDYKGSVVNHWPFSFAQGLDIGGAKPPRYNFMQILGNLLSYLDDNDISNII